MGQGRHGGCLGVRLVVAGAGGGLGRAFLDVVPPVHDVDAFTHADLDVADRDVVMRTLRPLRPDAILNFAAYTDVDGCESAPLRAMRDNELGPRSLAETARASGAVLVHVSTDYVFDGEKGRPYDERDRPNPVSVYARSKLAGERAVADVLPEHFIVRTGYVFGSGKDYCTRALRRLRAGRRAGGIADRVGSPTYVRHLADRIVALVLTERFGMYHLAGDRAASWFDVLCYAKTICGLAVDVDAQQAHALGLVAPRPKNSSLVSVFLRAAGVPPVPPFEVGLHELLDRL